MSIKLLTEHHLEFLSSKDDCTCSSETIHVKIPHCWKSHLAAHISTHSCLNYEVHLLFEHGFYIETTSNGHRFHDVAQYGLNPITSQMFSFVKTLRRL